MFNKFLKTAELFDAFRIAPRILLVLITIGSWVVLSWFTDLLNPTDNQLDFATYWLGLISIVCTWYLSTGRKWK